MVPALLCFIKFFLGTENKSDLKMRRFGVICLGAIACFLTSCGIHNYESSRYVKVKGIPETDFYLVNQKSNASFDGYEKEMGALNAYKTDDVITYVGSTDAEGNGVLTLSTKQYKQGKSRVYAIKTGYEPAHFKLSRKFNTAFLADIIFPVAFFFDHARVLNDKKVNNAYLWDESESDCYEYMDMAYNAEKSKMKREYLRKAIAQDHRNEEGICALALEELAALEMEEGRYHNAYLVLKDLKRMVPSYDLRYQVAELQAYVDGHNKKVKEKEERWDKALSTLDEVGAALTATGVALEEAQANSQSSVVESVEMVNGVNSVPSNYPWASELAREKQKLQQLYAERERLIKQRAGIRKTISSSGSKQVARAGTSLRLNRGQVRAGQGNYGTGAAERNLKATTTNTARLKNIEKRILTCRERIRVMEEGGDPSTVRSSNIRADREKGTSLSELGQKQDMDRVYRDYENQLRRMDTGMDDYNDSQKEYIQGQMRSLREKYGLQKSEWEDW